MENLTAFTKLYGYVKFFHPSSEAQKIDWDKFAIYGSSISNNAAGDKDLILKLQQLFNPIAPSIKIYLNNSKPELNSSDLIPEDTTGYQSVFWQHLGVEDKTDPNYKAYFSKLGSFDKNDTIFGRLKKYPLPGEYFTYKLNDEISVSLPHALFEKDSVTYPPANKNDFDNLQNILNTLANDFTYANPDVRYGCIAITWTTLQHFYPYFDVIKTDWNKSLNDALLKSSTDTTNEDFKRTLRKMITTLKDGHGAVSDAEIGTKIYSPPFEWMWIKDSLIITNVLDESASFKAGDRILEIDGVKTLEAIENEEQYIPGATISWKRLNQGYGRSVTQVLLGEINSEVTLKVKSADRTEKTISVTRKEPHNFFKIKNPWEKIKEIENGILYVDLPSTSNEELPKVIERMVSAKGIIIDIRGYPICDCNFLQHMTDSKLTSALWNIPITVFPDRQNVEFYQNGIWEMEPEKLRIKGKVVFLINAAAISYAESIIGIVEAYKLGEIVGEPTAGTNGNVNNIKLPCGYKVRWTGMKVLKHDGSQHHGIGILPTVPCKPTIKGVLEGKDEQLEKAIEVVTGKIKGN